MRNVLTAFVDRKAELARFCDMLESDQKPIMLVWGEDGIGKSSLLARLIHECSGRKLRKAEVFSTKDRFNSYLKIMRKIRDDIGAELFPNFTQTVNLLYPDPAQPAPLPTININVSGTQSVLDRGKMENVNVGGDIAGVVVKDLMINIPRSDITLPPRDRMIRLTDDFIRDLAPAVGEHLLIVFFDDIQEWAEETWQWFWEEVVGALQRGKLRNVRLVLCGRDKPPLGRDAGMIVKEAALKPLELRDIENYLERSGVREQERGLIARMLLATSKGIPLTLAIQVDAILEENSEIRVRVDG